MRCVCRDWCPPGCKTRKSSPYNSMNPRTPKVAGHITSHCHARGPQHKAQSKNMQEKKRSQPPKTYKNLTPTATAVPQEEERQKLPRPQMIRFLPRSVRHVHDVDTTVGSPRELVDDPLAGGFVRFRFQGLRLRILPWIGGHSKQSCVRCA